MIIESMQWRVTLAIHLTFWFFFSALMTTVLFVGTGHFVFAAIAALTANLLNAALVYTNLYFLLSQFSARRKPLIYGSLLLTFSVAVALIKFRLFLFQYSHFDGLPIRGKPITLPVLTTSLMVLVSFLFFYLSSFFEKLKQEERLKAKKQEAEFRFLQGQMNPHFLFNCLNSVQGLILNDQPEEAEQYLTRFSKLVRQCLNHSRLEWIPLTEELRFLTNYLDLERYRLDNRFQYDLTLDPALELETLHVPSMLIQPIVENAIVHGLFGNGKNGKVDIKLDQHQSGLSVEVRNNGQAKKTHAKREKPKGHVSIAMETTRKRLELYSGGSERDQYFLKMLPWPKGSGMSVKILIPTTINPRNDQNSYH